MTAATSETSDQKAPWRDLLHDGRAPFSILVLMGVCLHALQVLVTAIIMPTIVADAYKYTIGHPYMYPINSLGYVENFLQMMFAVRAEPYVPNPVAVRALELMLILHADHEQNASTSTVRLAGSSGANPFACVAAGIATLWGPAHGGAMAKMAVNM